MWPKQAARPASCMPTNPFGAAALLMQQPPAFGHVKLLERATLAVHLLRAPTRSRACAVSSATRRCRACSSAPCRLPRWRRWSHAPPVRSSGARAKRRCRSAEAAAPALRSHQRNRRPSGRRVCFGLIPSMYPGMRDSSRPCGRRGSRGHANARTRRRTCPDRVVNRLPGGPFSAPGSSRTLAP
jgi:hypothetical protein